MNNFTLTDPLANEEVTILITLTAADLARPDRPILVSVGRTNQPPIIKTGRFSQLSDLIDQAWHTFGVRTELAAAQATTTTEAEIIAEVEVTAVPPETSSEPQTAALPTAAPPFTPKPQAKNLSLF